MEKLIYDNTTGYRLERIDSDSIPVGHTVKIVMSIGMEVSVNDISTDHHCLQKRSIAIPSSSDINMIDRYMISKNMVKDIRTGIWYIPKPVIVIEEDIEERVKPKRRKAKSPHAKSFV